VRVVPDVAVSGNSSGAGLMDGLMGLLMLNQTREFQENKNGSPKATVAIQPEKLS
jgi:hypothetical protein